MCTPLTREPNAECDEGYGAGVIFVNQHVARDTHHLEIDAADTALNADRCPQIDVICETFDPVVVNL
jgi:hypothetical protein